MRLSEASGGLEVRLSLKLWLRSAPRQRGTGAWATSATPPSHNASAAMFCETLRRALSIDKRPVVLDRFERHSFVDSLARALEGIRLRG